jgi:hypothetical protein
MMRDFTHPAPQAQPTAELLLTNPSTETLGLGLPLLAVLAEVDALIQQELALHHRTVDVLATKKHAVITEQLGQLTQLDTELKTLRSQLHKQAKQRVSLLQHHGIESGHLGDALAQWQHATGATTPEQFRQCYNALTKLGLQRTSLRELMQLALSLSAEIDELLALSLQWARQSIALLSGNEANDTARQASAYTAQGKATSKKPYASLPKSRAT